MATLVILAAGIGSRYQGLKQITPVGPNGETIIDYSVFDAIRSGFDRLVLVIRRDMVDVVRQRITSKFRHRIRVAFAYQEQNAVPKDWNQPLNREKPWGTGHALLSVETLIDTPFGVINADDFYGLNSYQVLGRHLHSNSAASVEYALVGFRLRDTLSDFGPVSRAICIHDHFGFLKGIEEITNIEKARENAGYIDSNGDMQTLSGKEIIFMNVWAFTPSTFRLFREQFLYFLRDQGKNKKAEFLVPDTINHLIQEGKVRVKVLKQNTCEENNKGGGRKEMMKPPSQWFGLTYQEDTVLAQKKIKELIDEDQYPERLWDK
jgi:UTP-glucose-1-phosphate uridylyltransferase